MFSVRAKRAEKLFTAARVILTAIMSHGTGPLAKNARIAARIYIEKARQFTAQTANIKLKLRMNKIKIIGAGLAGCEAAWQIANRGFMVELYEMRPALLTPAHKTGMLAEIVCSNSLGSENKNERISAAGILKEELEIFNSLILSCAYASRVPAGGALAVDREKFSSLVTEKIISHENIKLIREEYKNLPDDLAIIASGPLTSDSLAHELKELAGERIYFYDAVAPVLMKESINFEKVFVSGRYGRGDDYINCPLTKEEYLKFYEALINAERNLPHDFERNKYFEGCMPVEALADRGIDTLRFGPMKPKGLIDPKTGREPYAAVQLRQDKLTLRQAASLMLLFS